MGVWGWGEGTGHIPTTYTELTDKTIDTSRSEPTLVMSGFTTLTTTIEHNANIF